jgi:cytochrome P450
MPTRVPLVPDFQLKGWRFKQNDMIAWSSSIESFDEKVWGTGSSADPHPLDEFWSDRFVIYPNDPSSGPLKNPKLSPSTIVAPPPQKEKKNENEDAKPRFSLEGLSSSWLPYGGGVRLCPGRHFAKQEMISSTAIFLTAFDIELKVPQGFRPEVDQSYFGFETMPPKGVIPARIRRRKFREGEDDVQQKVTMC